MSAGKRRAVFLDRDGTINEEVNYLAKAEDVRLLPRTAQAIARLNAAGLAVVVVSNQSGLARGYFDEADLAAVQVRLNRLLAAGGARVDAYYFCPHHPEGVVEHYALVCDCRKPAPGLLRQAAEEMGLALAGSFMVGDRLLDVACGRSEGLTGIMVRTGHDDGPPRGELEEPDHVADDLFAAVEWILARLAEEGPCAS
jgi:D-glycero-D-manno-heptose 1,7-bisphosphate phosphatase